MYGINVSFHIHRWKFLSLLFFLAIPGLLLHCGAEPVSEGGRFATNLPISNASPTLYFDDVQPGTSHVATIQIDNPSSAPLKIQRFVFAGQQSAQYSLLDPPKLPFTLESRSSLHLRIQLNAKGRDESVTTLRLFALQAQNVGPFGAYSIRIQRRTWNPMLSLRCDNTSAAHPRQMNFGLLMLGRSKSLECRIRNASSKALTVKRLLFSSLSKGIKNADSSFLSRSSIHFPLTLPPQSEQSLTFLFRPSTSWSAIEEGVFTLYTEGLPTRIATAANQIWVTGRKDIAAIQVLEKNIPCRRDQDCQSLHPDWRCPAQDTTGKHCRTRRDHSPVLRFTSATDGQQETQYVVLRSTGTLPLQLTKLSTENSRSSFTIYKPGALPRMLKPGQEVAIRVVYRPRGPHPHRDKLFIHSNAGNKPRLEIRLEARDNKCVLLSQSGSLSFDGAEVKSVRLQNQGQRNCVIKDIQIRKQDKRFVLSQLPQKRFTLAPGQDFSFNVRFTPTGPDHIKNSIIVTFDDNETLAYQLSVFAKTISTKPCFLTSAKTLINFSAVHINTKKTHTLTFKNQGWRSCQLQGVQFKTQASAGTFSLGDTLRFPRTVAPGETLTLPFQFTPSSADRFDATLRFLWADKSSSQATSLRLTGRGATTCLALNLTSIDFQTQQRQCTSEVRRITVTHTGGKQCAPTLQVTGLTCAPGPCPQRRDQGDLQLSKVPAFPAALKAGQSLSFEAFYRPNQLGDATMTVSLRSDHPAQPTLSVQLKGQGVSQVTHEELFHQYKLPLVDILFVVDESRSMGEKQGSLAKNFRSLIKYLTRLNLDYHIGVIGTETNGVRFPSGCLRGRVKYITPHTPNPIESFLQNVKLGTRSKKATRGIQALTDAFGSARRNDPNCNQGFLRSSASLSVIILSDSDDSSPATLTTYASVLEQLKGVRNAAQIRVSAITGPPQGCRAYGIGHALPGLRYRQLSKRFRGSQESICSSNWGQTITNAGSSLFGYPRSFQLTRQPKPESLTVKVNGRRIPRSQKDSWYHDTKRNTIEFSFSQVPSPGARIQVSYQAFCR